MLKSLLKSGITHAEDPLRMRRVVFFNYLIVFCVLATIFLGGITAAFVHWPQAFICFFGTLLYLISFVLNRNGVFGISKYVFLGATLLLISLGTYLNVQSGLFVESENMLLGLMAISLFILDGKQKHYAYWVIFGVFISMKCSIILQNNNADSLNFALGIINNTIVGAVLYAFIITFRSILIKAMDRDEQHERRLYSMIDNIPIFLALIDKDDNYILSNERYATNFKIPKRSIQGKNRKEVLPQKIIQDQEDFYKRAKYGESVSFLQETQLPNGSTISANGRYQPIFGEDGNVEAVSVCVDDVTPLIEAQEALRVANETKDKLFSIVAHDIKSPLNMFETFLNMSSDSKMSPEDFFEYQKILKEKVSALSTTVNELLEWSRMQLGGINAYPESVNVCGVVKENVELFDSIIRNKNIEFKVDVSDDIDAWIDQNHFKVAIRNLIHNAIKFTNGGGQVAVKTDQNDKETIVQIVDSGVGMDSKTIDRVIKKEIQDSQAGTEKELGTGLGLSLSLGLLERNNCEISVESQINKGTTFEIRIPNRSV